MAKRRKTTLNERICFECDNMIHVERGSYDDIIYFDGKYYHKQCFISMCERKSKNKKSLPKWKDALDNLDEIISNTKNVIDNAFDKDDVCQLIHSFYGVTVISTRVFQKLDEIYSGTLKGLVVPIPPRDLYDMWKRKRNYLIKLKSKNVIKGKVFSDEQQIIYDLSVLVNKYDSYLRYKEQQKIIEQQNEEDTKIFEDITLHSSLFNSNKNNKNNNDEDDIDSLLDEIFN